MKMSPLKELPMKAPPLKTFAIVGRNTANARRLTHELRLAGFRPSSRPVLVFSLGGDGTYLFAERKFPGIPKILIRDNSICNQCNENTLHDIIEALRTRQYAVKSNVMLAAAIQFRKGKAERAGKKQLVCTNDFILRNKDPTQALRFTVSVNGKHLGGTFVGDGVIIATPFGSTGYFYSATRKKFTRGIGVAFNNTHLHHAPLFLPDHSRVVLTVIRADAQFAADNNPSFATLHPGDSVAITKSPQAAKIVALKVGWKGVFDKLFNNRRRSLF